MPEAAAAPLAESLLVESVAAPAALDIGIGATELGALAPAMGELGGLGGLLGGGVSSAGTGLGAGALEGGLGSIAPEAFAQTQAALANALPGANQIQTLDMMRNAAANLPTAGPGVQVADLANGMGNVTPQMLQSATPLAQAPTLYGSGLESQLPTYAAESNFAEPVVANTEAAAYPSGVMGGAQQSNGIMDMLKNSLGSVGKFVEENPKTSAAAAGLGGYLLGQKKSDVPGAEKYNGPLSKFHYNPSAYTPTIAQPPANPYRAQYTSYAKGGIADLGGYSDGGQMLKGPGDGMSDSIPATIANKQPARLANEEFVVPADVVSHLGNGSSDAGAKQLYSMMDRVRKARTGNKKQGKQINAHKFMPA